MRALTKPNGDEMSLAANAIALRVAKFVGRLPGSHNDKFDALVAVIAALGVPDEHHLKLAEQIIAGTRNE